MNSWYVIRSKPRRETTALMHLERQGYRAYLPRMVRQARIRGRWVERIEPLFPSYLFVQTDVGMKSLAPVRSSVGVADIVRFGGGYATAPEEIVQQLMDSSDPDTGLHELRLPPLTQGAHVRVADGPFDGLEGIFQCYEGERRAMILLEVLGRETRVCLPVNQVVPECYA